MTPNEKKGKPNTDECCQLGDCVCVWTKFSKKREVVEGLGNLTASADERVKSRWGARERSCFWGGGVEDHKIKAQHDRSTQTRGAPGD